MAKSALIDRIYFALSGIFAVCLYILMISFIVFLIFGHNSFIKISIDNPSKIDSVAVTLIDMPSEPSVASVPDTPRPSAPNDTPPKEVGSTSPLAGLGAGDLFKKIDTKKPSNEPKDSEPSDNRDLVASNRQGTNDISRSEKISEILQRTQTIKDSISNLNQNIAIADSTTSQFCTTHKDYCDEIMELLYANWHIKSGFDVILSSVVSIDISKDGVFSYTIKKKSGNEIFDSELAESLESLKSTRFPTLKNVNIDRLEVTFRNKKER